MKLVRLIALAAAVSACSGGGMADNPSRLLPSEPTFDRFNLDELTVGQVYTLSNEASGNRVLAYNRALNGALTPAGSYATGGLGTGGGLGSQGAVALDELTITLLAVNAGSNELSAFRVNLDGSLRLTDKVASGGTMPISVTVSRGVVYVLNAGGAGNIAGFRLSLRGDLSPILGSVRPLSTSSAGPAEISFSQGGQELVVTEKNTDRITTYSVNFLGAASAPTETASSGVTPFGFAFTNSGTLVVSEANGGAPDGSSVSSYRAQSNDRWSVVSASVPTTETSACWIAITDDGRFAYTTNAASGTITGYSIDHGALTRLTTNGVTGNIGAGSGPTDMALSRASRFLYALAGGSHQIAAFAVDRNGGLTPLPGWVNGLPNSDNGLVAR